MRIQGSGSNEINQTYWMRAMNWTHGLLDEGPRPKSQILSLNLDGIILERKLIGPNPKKKLKRRACESKNQDAS